MEPKKLFKILIVIFILKIVLSGLLIFSLIKTRNAINSLNSNEIRKYFLMVEILIYICVLLSFLSFCFILWSRKINQKNRKKMYTTGTGLSFDECGISCVNMSLAFVLLAFVSQLRSTMKSSNDAPVSYSYLSQNFKFIEILIYIFFGFNIVTGSLIFYTDGPRKMISSPFSYSLN